jgi:hypothetical protein
MDGSSRNALRVARHTNGPDEAIGAGWLLAELKGRIDQSHQFMRLIRLIRLFGPFE